MKRVLGMLLLGGAALTATAAPAAELTLGADLYRQHCAACHGASGEGDGPVAAVIRINVPNLRTLQTRNRGKFPAQAVQAYIDGRDMKAAHGDRQMPIWGNVFQPHILRDDAGVAERIAAIVDFIAELQYP